MIHLLPRMLFCLSIFTFTQVYTNESHAQCNIDDWQALQALYVSAGGAPVLGMTPGWTNTTGWDQVDPSFNSTPPPGCDLNDLHGVQLDANGRVLTLNLVNNGLVGTIPVEIGDLANLQSLSLGNNQLTGAIPSEIENLVNLIALELDRNQLGPIIPAEIWTLTELGSLSLGRNLLTGTIPSDIGNLVNLRTFDVGRNQLSGDIPVELWTLTELLQIIMNDNQFTGTIPPAIGNLTNLINLLISDNQLTGSIPMEIGNLDLTNLLLDRNQFTGEIPSTFCNLTNLIQFNLTSNQLTGCYDPCMTALCNFGNGNVSHNNNLDAPFEDFCMNGIGVCMPPSCEPIAHVEVQSADVYIDDACYGVILTSPSGLCFRLRVEDDGSFTSEMVTCP